MNNEDIWPITPAGRRSLVNLGNKFWGSPVEVTRFWRQNRSSGAKTGFLRRAGATTKFPG